MSVSSWVFLVRNCAHHMSVRKMEWAILSYQESNQLFAYMHRSIMVCWMKWIEKRKLCRRWSDQTMHLIVAYLHNRFLVDGAALHQQNELHIFRWCIQTMMFQTRIPVCEWLIAFFPIAYSRPNTLKTAKHFIHSFISFIYACACSQDWILRMYDLLKIDSLFHLRVKKRRIRRENMNHIDDSHRIFYRFIFIAEHCFISAIVNSLIYAYGHNK